MPTASIAPDLQMHYEVDDFTDPWRASETILMIHGSVKSSTS